MEHKFCLRNKIDESKAWYLRKYGKLDWQWYDEGLIYAVMDYHSCKGSLLNFTEDDWLAAEENGLTRAKVEYICEEEDDEELCGMS